MTLHKVLIVDDEHGVRGVLTRVLKCAGYDTCTAANRDEALRQFRQERWWIYVSQI